MESVAWDVMYKSMHASDGRTARADRRATMRRIGGFARPHRRRIAIFLALSIVTAVLTVITPLLAGRVVNLITSASPSAGRGIVVLALVIAAIAVAEAAASIGTRWLSSNIGEGLIFDLRRAVFDHVQRMPVAFFTRTRTGALVSRLNNDVIGAQRAFSDTLSGVVSNVVTLVLTLGVMTVLSWQITLLTLILLPVFVVPARRMGRRMAGLAREGADHNARMSTQMTALANARVEVMSALVSFERVFEVLDLSPLIADRPDARTVPDVEHGVTVRFDGVSFAYPAADKVSLASLEEVAQLDSRGGGTVLHDVDLEVTAGSMVALVGSSGAGKSTVASLATRLYDVDAGAVTLNGVDLRDLTAESVHRTVGLVTQDGHLFHDTVAANLRLARPGAADDELWSALDRARLGDLIGALPNGLDTVVGERGYRLSGGERQRLTIARLLLARPAVVILDEATAHLDSTSEAAVSAALAEALTGRTSLVIAHRLSTVRAADEIVVLEAGRVVERGDHRTLLAAGGRYAELYRTQFAPA